MAGDVIDVSYAAGSPPVQDAALQSWIQKAADAEWATRCGRFCGAVRGLGFCRTAGILGGFGFCGAAAVLCCFRFCGAVAVRGPTRPQNH
jgi:hypothetical protein